jgi:hypothetical protein
LIVSVIIDSLEVVVRPARWYTATHQKKVHARAACKAVARDAMIAPSLPRASIADSVGSARRRISAAAVGAIIGGALGAVLGNQYAAHNRWFCPPNPGGFGCAIQARLFQSLSHHRRARRRRSRPHRRSGVTLVSPIVRDTRRKKMPNILSYSLVLATLGFRLEAQAPIRLRGPVDSVVLVRTSVPGWPCPKCPPVHVALRREVNGATVLEAFRRKADSLGFYALPADVMGAGFCRVVRSDDLMATLHIYHSDGQWSVRGYHHCRDRSPEQTGLLVLEALVDSLSAVPQRTPPPRTR